MVVKQSIGNNGNTADVQQVIYRQGKRVPALEGDEQLLTKQELDALVGLPDQSGSLASMLGNNSSSTKLSVEVSKLVEQIVDKWKSKHVDSAAVRQTVTVRAKRNVCTDR